MLALKIEIRFAFNPSTHSGNRGRRISEFEDSQGYTVKPYLEK